MAITYNSQMGNGMLGMGWSLNGLSTITLDNKNIYYDNEVEPLSATAEQYILFNKHYEANPFLLDNNRLIALNGNYGAAGTTYGLNSENFSLITSLGSVGSCTQCPLSFTVKTKEGSILEYGNTTDSRILATDNIHPIMWRLNKLTDNNGNYVEYVYELINGETRIKEINYTGNIAAGLIPYNKIKFIYAERNDKNFTFFRTSSLETFGYPQSPATVTTLNNNSLLEKVEIYSENNLLVKTYELGYAFDGLYSLLQEIKEIGYENSAGTELNSTIFRYGTTTDIIANVNTTFTENTTNYISTKKSDNFSGDFDGDGYTDIMTAYYDYKIQNGNNYGKEYTSFKIFRKIPNSNNFQEVYSQVLSTWAGTIFITVNLKHIKIGDFNGDGLSDILFDNYEAYLSNPKFEKKNMQILYSLGYNGSNAINFSTITYPNSNNLPYKYLNFGNNIELNPIVTGDFDGDGVTDIINTLKTATTIGSGGTFYYDYTCACYKYNVNTTGGESKMFVSFPAKNIYYQEIVNAFSSGIFTPGFLNDNKKIQAVADFDGDGKDDILVEKGHIYTLSKDASSQYIFNIITKNRTSGNDDILNRYYIGDYNGDGKADMLSQQYYPNYVNDNSRPWYIGYSTGNFCVGERGLAGTVLRAFAFNPYNPIMFDQNPTSKNTRILTADFNGDGKADILTQEYRIYIPSIVPSNRMRIYFSNGSSFVSGGAFDINTYGTLNIGSNDIYLPDVLGDFNGDGAVDILNKLDADHATNAKPYVIVSFGNQQKERFLRKIIDGFLRKTEINYKPLTNGADHYIKGNTILSYPLNYIQIPIYTVSTVSVSDGIGGMKTTTLKYFGLKTHKTGLGILGFDKIIETNSQNNFVTESVFETKSTGTDTYYPNALKSMRIYNSSGGNDIYKKEFTNSFEDFGNRRYFNYVSLSNENNYINGTNNQTQYIYDVWNGNISGILSSIGNGIEESIQVFNSYGTYANAPYPNLPADITIGKHRLGNPFILKNIHYDYASNGNPITIKDFYNTAKQTTTINSYNALGLATSTNTSGNYTSSAGSMSESITENMNYLPNGRMLTTYEIPNLQSTISNNISNYDKRWGLPTFTYDANNRHTIQSTYDAFGKLIKVTPSVANGATAYDITTTYDWSTQYNSTYKITSTTTGKAPISSYYDLFNRLVRKEQTLNGKLTFEENIYNAKGEIVIQKSNNANSGIITTTNTYDEYHRLKTSSNSATGVTTSLTYNITAGNLVVQNSTTNQPDVKTTYDATGKIIKVEESGDGTTIANDYTYHSNGNISTVAQGGTILITNEYDEYGNQIKMTDVDAGQNLYEYDAFGQITKQTDAKGNVIENIYDNNARLISKNVTDISIPSNNTTETYTYNPLTVDGPGKLKMIQRNGITDPTLNLKENYEYDNFDRLKKTIRNFEGKDFVTEIGYGNYDQINKVIYPAVTTNPTTLNYTLTNDGFVTNISSINGTGYAQPIFNTQPSNYNAFGQIKIYSLGNGKFSTRTYNDIGLPTSYRTDLIANLISIQKLSMSWDLTTGNLTQRKEESTRQYKPNFTENFTYDKFHRLKTMQVNSEPVSSINYDANGNITNKFDAGTEYRYKSDKIHAVEYIKAGMGYSAPQPDDRTDISTTNQDIIYNAFNQPALITEGNKELKYIYDFNGQRIKSIYKENGNHITSRYYMGNYEFETNGGAITNPASIVRQLNYIYAPSGLVSVLYKEVGSADAYVYTYTDHLGSIVHITLNNGLVLFDQNFDAWGRQRNPMNWSYTGLPVQPAAIYRGFTGHEMVPQFSLINMNGRMYDPIVGRMLSPDNEVADAFNTQTYNRYSYVWNNPLKYNDPSGEGGVSPNNFPGFEGLVWNGSSWVQGTGYTGPMASGTAISSSFGNIYDGATTQAYTGSEMTSMGNAFASNGTIGGGMSPQGLNILLNFSTILINSFVHWVKGDFNFNNSHNINASIEIINNVSSASKGVSSGNGCIMEYMNNATAQLGNGYIGHQRPLYPHSNNYLRAKHSLELSENNNKVISLNTLRTLYGGYTLGQLLDGIPANNYLHSFGEGPTNRFIIDPIYFNVVIDLKHFLYSIIRPSLFGDINEYIQERNNNPSAHNPQDYYSNNLGNEFYNFYRTKQPEIMLPHDKNLIEYIIEFLNSLKSRKGN